MHTYTSTWYTEVIDRYTVYIRYSVTLIIRLSMHVWNIGDALLTPSTTVSAVAYTRKDAHVVAS